MNKQCNATPTDHQASGAAPRTQLSPCAKAAFVCILSLQALHSQGADYANATVVGGSITGSTVGTRTTVNQTSQRGALDWTQLSTAANETLQFNLPNSSAMIFNRITGSSPSNFLGPVNSIGQVFIQNPNGILFGAGTQVNVGGLVASTLSMTPTDFMNGNFVFTKEANSTGSIRNLGNLTAAQGGYIALLSPSVINEGIVSANLGKALLAAGNKVTLNLNNGSLLSYSIDQGAVNALVDNKQLVQANGGEVIMSAKALDSLTSSVVNNTGIIEATSLTNVAGKITLNGDSVVSTGSLDSLQININTTVGSIGGGTLPPGQGGVSPGPIGPINQRPLDPINWINVSNTVGTGVVFNQPSPAASAVGLTLSLAYQATLNSVGRISANQTGGFGTVQTGTGPLNLTSSPTISGVNPVFLRRATTLDAPEN